MRKLFFGARYNVMHKDITPENAYELLKDDVRALLLGDVKSFLYPSRVYIPGTDFVYVGGYYYEEGDGTQKSIVNAELNEIKDADIVCLDFTKPGAIATISELFYGISNKKHIVIFKNPNLTNDSITSEYWFIFETIKRFEGYYGVSVYDATSDDEIIKIVKSL